MKNKKNNAYKIRKHFLNSSFNRSKKMEMNHTEKKSLGKNFRSQKRSLFLKIHTNGLRRNNKSIEGKAAESINMNNIITAISAIHYYKKDLNT